MNNASKRCALSYLKTIRFRQQLQFRIPDVTTPFSPLLFDSSAPLRETTPFLNSPVVLVVSSWLSSRLVVPRSLLWHVSPDRAIAPTKGLPAQPTDSLPSAPSAPLREILPFLIPRSARRVVLVIFPVARRARPIPPRPSPHAPLSSTDCLLFSLKLGHAFLYHQNRCNTKLRWQFQSSARRA